MSLVELSIALFVISIAVAALGASLLGSIVAMDSNESRVRATALSNELLEELVGMPWAKAGLYEAEAAAAETASPPGLGLAAPATFEGEELVRLPAASPRDPQVPQAREAGFVRDGRTFDVRRHVLWGDQPDIVGTRDYKHFVVVVSWTHRGQTKSVRNEAVRSPTPDEEQVQGFTMTFSSILPSSDIEISASGAIQTAMTVEVTTSQTTATAPRLSFPQRAGTASPRTLVMANPSGDQKTWTSTLNVGGAERFSNGFVTFTVQALNALAQPVVATDQVVFLQPMGLQSFVSSQTTITVCRSNGHLVSQLVLDLDVRGVTDTDIVSITGSNSSVAALAALPATRNEAGHTFQLTIPTTQTFSGPNTQFTVVADRQRLPANLTVVAPTTYPIGVNNSC
jgi:hypothetical protein